MKNNFIIKYIGNRMIVRLDFNPNEITTETEENEAVYLLFKYGHPAAIKFWLLWKRGHITNQYFNNDVLHFSNFLKKNFDDDFFDIDDVIENITLAYSGGKPSKFICENWEYFSRNIRRRISYRYNNPSGSVVFKEVF